MIDDTDEEEELKSLLEKNSARMDSVCSQLAEAFAEQNLDLALELTVKLQYYNRIDETIREKMD
jgi:DnaJ-domain-containing protein 1